MSLGKKRSRFVTAQMRRNALVNADRFDWARDLQEKAIDEAAPWVARSDEDLWQTVTAQELPRTIYTNAGLMYGTAIAQCSNCGEAASIKHGRSFWVVDSGKPWKTTCLECGEVYPKNDFGAFYASALDDKGMFRKELGDRSLLVNPESPGSNVYVDDGYGMVDEKGLTHHPIAYYNFEFIWRQQVQAGVQKLSRAFTLTDERKYAHKAAVLLDRIADVYPEMDLKPLTDLGFHHSHGGTGEGRIEGCIWETFVVQHLAEGYDAIFDGIQGDAELVAFCSAMANRFGLEDKGSIEAICEHIHENFLLEGLASVKDTRIRGNTGMTQCSLAGTAIALDDPVLTPEWLDWLFDPEYPSPAYSKKDPVNWVLTDGLDRDGMGGECGSYGFIWSRHMRDLAQMLKKYPEYTNHDLTAEYPKLKQAYLIESRLNVLDGMVPNTGDSGSVGSWGRGGSGAVYAEAYKIYQDPEFARMAWREHEVHGSDLRLASDVFEADPEVLKARIQAAAEDAAFALKSEHTGRYGQAHLQTERPENGRAVFIHYGYGKGHSHHDSLNIGILAKNVAMMPDLGYPEYASKWPKRGAWTSNTISHNTLLIGDRRSGQSPGGKIEMFVDAPPLRVMQVDARNAYEAAGTYRRTVALVDVDEDNSYVFDVFRARGGENHRLSWHGASPKADVDGLVMKRQAEGTFAGPDVPFAMLSGEKGDYYNDSGFTYLYDVERSAGAVANSYTVDWEIEDVHHRVKPGVSPHLRLHALTECDEVALATGDSPRKIQCPRYLIQSRLGENKESQFVTVLEPYDTAPFVSQVRALKIGGLVDENSGAAVSVLLADGREDILISCEQPQEVTVEGGITFHGMFGMVRRMGEKVTQIRMVGGTRLSVGDVSLVTEQGILSGKVSGVDATDPLDNRVALDPPLPKDVDLGGRTIHFVSDLPMDTSYEIASVTEDGISTGEITVVHGLQQGGNGYSYLVNKGDDYILPLVSSLDG